MTKVVLNVGGGSAAIDIPAYYDGWVHKMLDVAAAPGVDIVHDARDLTALPAAQYDAIYCSNNLEHYYKHDGRKVLAGFIHLLKPGGVVEIRVPDMPAVFRMMLEQSLDIDDELYSSPAGPITVHDVIYGWGRAIETSGSEHYAHKCGFTGASLAMMLFEAGFQDIQVDHLAESLQLCAFGRIAA
jgi:SAM-dependent methyltransferase